MLLEPNILYEDENTIAVNKPAGLVVHPSSRAEAHYGASSDGLGRTLQSKVLGKTTEPTLVDWILQKFETAYPGIRNVGEPGKSATGEIIYRPGVVHRLDRETSGVMLVAKTEKGFQNLKKQFQDHEIQKVYQAFVFGEIKQDKGMINRPIGRSASDFRKWSAQRGARGEMREALTEYEVMRRGHGYSFVSMMPKTGRTHQIRVHFKAINYPLVADSLYAPDKENSLGFKRLALHSHKITFTDTSGKSHTVTAPYPDDFKQALNLISYDMS